MKGKSKSLPTGKSLSTSGSLPATKVTAKLRDTRPISQRAVTSLAHKPKPIRYTPPEEEE